MERGIPNKLQGFRDASRLAGLPGTHHAALIAIDVYTVAKSIM